mgnify:CR=1 FL=1
MRAWVAGVEVELLAARALLWPAESALLVADLHVGKPEAFQRRGVPVPSTAGEADLARLSATLDATGARSLWVLGDLVHGAEAAATDGLARLRRRHPRVSLHVVRGNHDRHVERLPEAWGFEEHLAPATLGPFALCHEPPAAAWPAGAAAGTGGYALAGHLHPMVRLRGGGDELVLPCFQFRDRVGLLPAFTAWSSGVRVTPREGRTFAVTGAEVVAVPGPALSP